MNELVPVDGQSGDIVYTALVPVGSTAVTVLADRAQQFLTQYLLPSPTRVTTYGPRCKIRQRGIIRLIEWRAGVGTVQAYRVTLELTLKAGRYRYCLSQFQAYPDSVGSELSMRERHPGDKRTYIYQGPQFDNLLAWDRSVRAYIALLQQSMSQSTIDTY